MYQIETEWRCSLKGVFHILELPSLHCLPLYYKYHKHKWSFCDFYLFFVFLRSGSHSSTASLVKFSLNVGALACTTWWVFIRLYSSTSAPPPFDTEPISCGAPSLIPLLRDFFISILKKFSFIYDPLSSRFSPCAPNYVLNVKEQQLRLKPQRVQLVRAATFQR